MKKILFASTALVAAGLLGSGTASASEKITLQLGGFSKWWVVGAWNSSDYQTGSAGLANGTIARAYNNVDIKGDNEVWFGGNTTLDNGMKIGVDIHLEAGGHGDMTTDTIDKSYIYVEGGFGKFIVGTNKNGTYLLHVQAPDAAGNWGEGGEMTGNKAIAKPGTVNGMAGGNTTAIDTTSNADGITYVAPTFYGLTVGASYIPNGSEDSRGATQLNTISTTNSATNIKEVYGAGALYANTFGGVGVKVSAGVVTAQTGSSNTLNTGYGWFEQAYGTQLSYAGFTLGGSYRHQQDNYGRNTADLGTLGGISPDGNGSLGNGSAFDVGLQYANGPYGVSFVYFKSDVQHQRLGCNTGVANVCGNDEITAYQLSGKYNLGPGVDVLATAGYIDYDAAVAKVSGGDNNHNSGWTVMSGISLTF